MLNEEEVNFFKSILTPFVAQWQPSTLTDCTHTMSIDDVLELLGQTDEVEGLHRGKLTAYLTLIGFTFFEGMVLMESK